MTERELSVDPLAEHGRTYAPHEAVVEASRCLMCDDPPCNKGCPAGVDVRRFIRKIRFGNFRGAARLIRDTNVLVGVCGRVCPQEMLCMEHCTRANLDTPIDIAGLQRFAGDVELGTIAPVPEAPPRRKGKVAVIGAGPAGLAAAASLLRAGHEVEIFERGDALGGVLSRGIPPFRLDPGFVESELEYVRRLGALVHLGEHTKAPALLTAQGFDAVFVAVGLWKAHRLDIEGATLEGVLIAGDLLLAVARGERPAVGGRVVVIGGGNVAMDAATTALALGAARVDALLPRVVRRDAGLPVRDRGGAGRGRRASHAHEAGPDPRGRRTGQRLRGRRDPLEDARASRSLERGGGARNRSSACSRTP